MSENMFRLPKSKSNSSKNKTANAATGRMCLSALILSLTIVKNTTFSGKIKLGRFDKMITFYGGVTKPAGIYNAYLHNCTVGNNVYISNVTNHIANYVIEDDCIIDHIDLLAVEGQTTFGNGIKAVVINEAGGREVTIFDNLTAQIAYIIALHRHRTDVREKLEKLIAQYAESVKSDIGIIGKGAHLSNCGTIKNVKIGPAAIIGNVKRLENGTIKSCPQDPTEVGASVVAKDFIIAEGVKISEGSIISDCFIGQATKMTQAVFSGEFGLFCQLWFSSRRDMLDFRRSLHSQPSQIHSAYRGTV